MNESIVMFLVILSLVSMTLAVIGFVFCVTFAFRRIELVEGMLASPGNQIYLYKSNWGRGIVGRWVRSTAVYHFFLFRNIPLIGKRVEPRIGRESEPVPRVLRLWVVLPVGLTSFFGWLFLLSGGIAMLLD